MSYWRVMRCSDGHLFEAPFIPFVSFKAIRLPAGRIQRCPVDGGWRRVNVEFTGSLSERERDEARRHRTSPVP